MATTAQSKKINWDEYDIDWDIVEKNKDQFSPSMVKAFDDGSIDHLSDAEKKRFEILLDRATPKNLQAKEESSLLGNIGTAGLGALTGAIDAMDYVGGVARTGVGALGNLSGKEIVSKQDVLDAITPFDSKQAPSVSDMMVKAGADDSVLTSALGFAGDILLDPLTYGTGGLSAINKLAKSDKLGEAIKVIDKMGEKIPSLSRFVSKKLDDAGKFIYSGALNKLDNATIKNRMLYGKDAGLLPTQILYKEGAPHTYETALQRATEIINNNVKERAGIEDLLINKKPNLLRAMGKTNKLIDELGDEARDVYSPLAEKALRESGGIPKTIYDKMNGVIDLKGLNGAPIVDSSGRPFRLVTKEPTFADMVKQRKTIDKVLYSLKDPKLGELSDSSRKIWQTAKTGMKEEIERGINEISPELAQKYKYAGMESSAFIDALPLAQRGEVIEHGKATIPVLTSILAGDTIGRTIEDGTQLGKMTRLLAGLGAKAVNAPETGTKIAIGLKKMGEKKGIKDSGLGTLDQLARRLMINSSDLYNEED